MKDKNNYVTWTQVGKIISFILILLGIAGIIAIVYNMGYVDGHYKSSCEWIESYHVHHSYITGYGI